MIHPLVIDPDRPFHFGQVGDRIFGQDSHTVAVDQIRNAVMDLRIDMIGPAGQHDAPAAGFGQIPEGFFALGLDILVSPVQFFPCFVGGRADLRIRQF